MDPFTEGMRRVGDAALDLSPVARNTDPDTSHDAAASVEDVRESQRNVYDLLDAIGPMTDEELCAFTAQWRQHKQSPSGTRTRRAELVRMGLVEWSGEKRRMTTGRMARVWQVKR